MSKYVALPVLVFWALLEQDSEAPKTEMKACEDRILWLGVASVEGRPFGVQACRTWLEARNGTSPDLRTRALQPEKHQCRCNSPSRQVDQDLAS
jgi:hypothetical protein